MTLIALVGQLPDEELQRWQTALQAALPGYSFKLHRELNATQQTQCHYAVVANPSTEQLEHYPNLIWVQSLWAGVEKLVAQFKDSTIKVTRLIDPGLAASMAEAMLTWCLFFQRNFHRYQKLEPQKLWQPLEYITSNNTTVGVLGLGALGRQTCNLLTAQGFQVKGWSRTQKTLNNIECFAGKSGLSELLPICDIIISLLPLTDETFHLIDAMFWQQVKPEVCFINAGRGQVLVENDLLKALNSNKVNHAVLDVFQTEPLPESHPFWAHESITVLPHICSPTQIETASSVVCNNLKRVLDDKEFPELVDFTIGY